MVAQQCNEVIVVDYSCPEGTGKFVSANFPSVRLATVKGQDHFSNWRARNAGAAIAQSDVLIFVDADTLLADGAIDWISASITPGTFGFFDTRTSQTFNPSGPRVAANQLKGFQVIPTQAFRRVGGYDEVLEGYAAGADTDLEYRLARLGLKRQALDARIIESVVQHDAASRTANHAQPIKTSYAAGLLYRAAKRTMLQLKQHVELPLETRRNLYSAATKAALGLTTGSDRIAMKVRLGREAIMMPRQLGYERGAQTNWLNIEVVLEDPLAEPVE